MKLNDFLSHRAQVRWTPPENRTQISRVITASLNHMFISAKAWDD